MQLSYKDVEALKSEPSSASRAGIARKLAIGYDHDLFAPHERHMAEDIFRLLLKDAEVKVRKELSELLCHNRQVPHDIILDLAHDVTEVATPVLENSYVLTEEDLVHIVRSAGDMLKCMAVARRQSVSGELAAALLDTHDGKVIRVVFANKGAALPEAQLERVLAAVPADDTLLGALIARGGLSNAFVTRLFDKVSHTLKREIVKKYKLPFAIIEPMGHLARDRALLDSVTRSTNPLELYATAQSLYQRGRLDDALVLRALCVGDLAFFEAALSVRAGVPLMNARLLMLDSGPHGFQALYEKAALPTGFFNAVQLLLGFALEETRYGMLSRADFRKRMIERIMAGQYDRRIENMAYLTTVIADNSLIHANIH